MPEMILQTWLQPPGRFSMFNREERNAVAMLYAALLHGNNLARFAEAVGWNGLGDPAAAEVFVEWAYARDLWNLRPNAESRRAAILGLLRPRNADWLRTCSVHEFNGFFGAVPQPSADYVQYPGRWSLMRFAKNLPDDDEFRRACVFKWAFNVKPDLVVHGTDGELLCIEAKWESGEGSYPSSQKEKAEFVRRNLKPASQTEVQRFLVEDVLGYEATFRYLVRTGTAEADSHGTLTWKDAFAEVAIDHLPAFVRDWVDGL